MKFRTELKWGCFTGQKTPEGVVWSSLRSLVGLSRPRLPSLAGALGPPFWEGKRSRPRLLFPAAPPNWLLADSKMCP